MSGTVNVKILFFAKAREIFGKSVDYLEVETPITHKNLLEIIVNHYSLNQLRNQIILSINQDFLEPGDQILTLKPGDEIAVIPPLSGG